MDSAEFEIEESSEIDESSSDFGSLGALAPAWREGDAISEEEALEMFYEWLAEHEIDLWPHQDEALMSLMVGDHVILGTPTGSGKSMVAIGMMFGFQDSPKPWGQVEHRKFLCPVPGYDRHFAITEEYGFELISVPMTPNGPDMDIVEKLVAEDDTIKGIWCVPQYSNPDGYTYSDETIDRMAKMKTAAPDFKIFWDEAYIVHHLTDEIIETPVLLNEAKKYGNEDRVFMFTSTSKITFPGAGISAIACSENSMKYMCKRFSTMIISYDKMNQLRHVRFLKNKAGVLAHMAKHRRRLVPCFDAVKTTFAEELTPCGNIAHWTNPKGGYFISLYVMPGCAKRVAQLCKECGLTLTGAGSAYPYHKDPQDSHLRIAPTYPSLDEVETASELLCVCVRLAVVEKLLSEQA